MRKKISITSKEMALKALGKNFEFFEMFYLIFSNPGISIPLDTKKGYGNYLKFGSKKDKVENNVACFEAALVAVMQHYQKDNINDFEFSQDALETVFEYAEYYSAMKGLSEKNIGISISKEKDEYGLPTFLIDAEKLKETEKALIAEYGENWREEILKKVKD